jgi:uncharacterized protein
MKTEMTPDLGVRTTGMRLSRYHVVSPPFVDQDTSRVKRVIYATRTADVCVLNEEAWQLIQSGQFEQLPPEMLFHLVELELIIPAKEDELQVILDRNKAAILDEEVLYLVVQSTAWCQLGCGYCGQRHYPQWLSKADQDRFVERTRKKLAAKQYSTMEIGWFGGEPLAGLSIIRTLAPRLRQLALEFGCSYRSKIVTNGVTLTDAVATELVRDLAVSHIEVTLDGTIEFHDARRYTKGGKPTFTCIFSNVVALAQRNDLDVQLSIRCNVDRRNYNGIVPLLHMLADAGIQEKIEFYAAPIHSWGNDAHLESLSTEEFASWESSWLSEMIRLGFMPALIPPRKPVVCLAVMPNGELVDANGDLFNCTEVSYVPKYGNPNQYSIGNLSNGEIPDRRDLLGDFNERVGRAEYQCASCRMLPVCGGACPKLWQEGLVPCPSAKYNIEQRLLLALAVYRTEAVTSI